MKKITEESVRILSERPWNRQCSTREKMAEWLDKYDYELAMLTGIGHPITLADIDIHIRAGVAHYLREALTC